MNLNSYSLILCILLIYFVVGLFGANIGYEVDGIPVYDANPLTYLGAMMSFQIDGFPSWLSFIFDIIPFFVAWVVYRQVRGQD